MRLGILGGGQLARMLALAAAPLGVRCLVLDPAPAPCAADVAEHLCAAYDDQDALDALASRVDAVTVDFENVPAASTQRIAMAIPVRPHPRALAIAQDRLHEKRLFAELGLTPAGHRSVDGLDDLERAVERLGLPLVLKTRRLGYDGKGQVWVRERGGLELPLAQLGGTDLIAESAVGFAFEISQLLVRALDGSTRAYPASLNVHHDGILRASLAPMAGGRWAAMAADAARRIAEGIDYVGVLAVEFFATADGRLIVNEIAPRVHNSGHWTLNGAVTSQFENHVRAVLGWPLAAVDALGASLMLNIIGERPPTAALLAMPDSHLHDYGKAERVGRKLGHVNLRAADRGGLLALLEIWRTAGLLPDAVSAADEALLLDGTLS